MDVLTNKEVAEVFSQYPKNIRQKLMLLRQLVLDTASETEGINRIEETLKWGEPGYLVKGGTTIRMAWKESEPDEYALYFNCKTRLADTFKELYGSRLNVVGNRAIVFKENDRIPVKELKHCILLALTYHRIKHLPMLGT